MGGEIRSGRVGVALTAVALGGFGIGTSEFAAMGLLPEMAATLHVSIPSMGYGISAYALGVVVGAPLITALTARLDRKLLLLGLMVAFLVGNGLSAIAPNAPLVYLARFIAGLPHGAYFGIASVVAARLVPAERAGRAVAGVMMGLTVSNIIGVPVATAVGQHLHWRAAYGMIAAIGLLTMVVVHFLVPAVPAAAHATIRTELGAFRRPQVWFALVTGIVGFGGMFAVYSYVSPTLTEVSGLPASGVPWVLAVFGVGMTVGTLLGGRLADHSIMGTLLGGMIGMLAVLVLFATTAQYIPAAIALIFLIGVACQVIGTALTMRLMAVSPDAPALAASSNHSALNLANAAGAWLGGVVIAAGYGYLSTAWVGAVLSVAGLVVLAASRMLERAQPPLEVGLPATQTGR
ncbi:MFS transporter [Catenuloplanes indicus]|uniref:DHA1 family inner membrane transport protein n=1 Tax=Catenuloplanes indicus TaxID=137267 RepID=A0AAE4AZ08_9ACTN|nr:MFS transporter [Catenuloplanes indicus]MDQ0368580.1 DHA1 family inner membrane transport protein [Catenuloplanes indicus]